MVFRNMYYNRLDYVCKINSSNRNSMKKTDYLWISLSAIGLFGLLANNRILFSKYDLEICTARIEFYSNVAKTYICIQRLTGTAASFAIEHRRCEK